MSNIKHASVALVIVVSAILVYSPVATIAAEPTAEGIEEVVVTARKREESISDVPVVVTAFSGDTLERFGITSVSDIAAMTPSFVVANTHSNAGGTVTIRGIGAAATNSAVDQAVSVNLDGVQVSQGNFLRMGQFDLEQVEILKGPQSLFFGKNSTAGIVSFRSRDPGETFEAYTSAGYEFSQKRTYVEGAVSGPVTDTVGARLFIYGADQEGWFRNSAATTEVPDIGKNSAVKTAPNGREVAGRLTLTIDPESSAFTGRFKLGFSDVDQDNGPAASSQKFLCPLGYSQASATALTGGVAPDYDECKLDRYYVSADPFPALIAVHPSIKSSPYSKYKQTLASFEANWKFNNGMTLTSVTGYYKFDQDYFDMYTYSNASMLASTSALSNKQWTEELRLASNFSGPINFMLGGFYQAADLSDAIVVALDKAVPQPVALSNLTYNQDTRSASAFAELTYRATETLDLSVGGRFTDEKKEFSGITRGSPIVVQKPENSFENFSFESTLRYRPSETSMVFASYREGFIAGGYDFNPTPPAFGPNTDVSYDESTANGFEVGYKGSLAENQIRVDAAVYRYKYKDMQLAARDAVTLSLTTLNAGEATVQGVDLGMELRPRTVPNAVLSARAAYTDATYDRFIASCWTGQSIAQGCNLLPNAAGAFTSQDLKGQDLVRAPEWTASLGGLYKMSVTSAIGASFALNASYSSRFSATVENDLRAWQPSYWMLNANLSMYSSDHRWEVALIGRNLTDSLTHVNSFSAPLTGAGTGTTNPVPSDLFGGVSNPREVAVQLRYNF